MIWTFWVFWLGVKVDWMDIPLEITWVEVGE
jgi:hypothetical protein